MHYLNNPEAATVVFHLNKAVEYLVLFGPRAVPAALYTSRDGNLHDLYRNFITVALGWIPPLPNGQTYKQQFQDMYQRFEGMSVHDREKAIPDPKDFFRKKQ